MCASCLYLTACFYFGPCVRHAALAPFIHSCQALHWHRLPASKFKDSLLTATVGHLTSLMRTISKSPAFGRTEFKEMWWCWWWWVLASSHVCLLLLPCLAVSPGSLKGKILFHFLGAGSFCCNWKTAKRQTNKRTSERSNTSNLHQEVREKIEKKEAFPEAKGAGKLKHSSHITDVSISSSTFQRNLLYIPCFPYFNFLST